MNAISPLTILLFGIALGACLPMLVATLRAWLPMRLLKRWFRPTMLQLDDVPSRRRRQPAPPTDVQP